MNANTIDNKEIIHHSHEHLLCWKSVIAGFFITVFTYALLTVFGAGVGGLSAANLIREEEGGAGLATAAGVWLGLSAVISLFIGSYFTVRVARFKTMRIGVANASIIAALFFLFMLGSAGVGIGSVARGLASTALAASSGAMSLASNPMIQDTVQKAIGTSTLKSPPAEVAQGLTLRLFQGNTESAKNYLAYQTGQTPAEVDQRVTLLQTEFTANAKIVAEKTAEGIAAAGWSLFVTFLLGIFAAGIGGWIAAKSNVERPLALNELNPDDYRAHPVLRKSEFATI